MRKFSVNRTNKKIEPTKVQIDRYKDFSQIYKDYSLLTKRGKRPIYRDPKLYLLFLLILIVMFLILSAE